MKKILLSLVVLYFISCSSPVSEINQVDKDKPHFRISMDFNTESYPSFGKKMYPQIAVWAQEKTTGFTKTIYVTKKGAKSDWFGAKERPDAFPVWYGIVGEEKKSANADIDSVTGATPSGSSFIINWQVPEYLYNKKIRLYLEANVSFDYNEYYAKDLPKNSPAYSGVNGQPSIIWMSEISLNGDDKSYEPVIIGGGQVQGKHHSIDKDISHVTTARELFKKISFDYLKGK